jgi:hypothetical protein
LARRAPEPEVQVTEKEVKSFEAIRFGLAGEVISVGLEETSGRIVCEVTVVNGSAPTKFVIDPASGESNGRCIALGTRSGAASNASDPRSNDWPACDARCQRSPRSKQLRSVIGIISLDHAIFRKISIEHRNFFRCRIAP